MNFIRVFYTLFVGILVATLIGVGIAAFYPAPKSPAADEVGMFTKPVMDATESAEYEAEQIKSQKKWQEYNTKMQEYNYRVAIISLSLSVVVLILGLWDYKKLPILSDALALGGVFGLIYSIGRGFEAQNEKLRFVVVAISLIATMFVGQKKLTGIIPGKKR